MDDVIVRSRYPRQSTSGRRKKKNSREESTLMETIARQILISVLILAAIGIIKSIDSPGTNFVSQKVKDILFQNYDINAIYASVESTFKNIFGETTQNKDENAQSKDNMEDEEAVPVSANVQEQSSGGKVDSAAQTGSESGQTQQITVDSEQKAAGTAEDSQQKADEAVRSQTQDSSKDSSGTAADSNKKSTTQESAKKTVEENKSSASTSAKSTTAVSSEVAAIKKKYSFITPAGGPLGSPYGERIDPFTKAEKFHRGVDIEANNGDSIKAALGGEIIEAANEKTYGNYLKIKHADGIVTVYAHCSALLVKKGQKVKQGDIIARVGATGAAIGAHLHFEIWKDGKSLNPLSFVKIPVKG